MTLCRDALTFWTGRENAADLVLLSDDAAVDTTSISRVVLRVDATTKQYSLGTGMIRLARSVLQTGSFAQIVQPVLDRLAATRGVTAMGVEVTPQQSVVVLAISRSNQPFRLHTDVGSQFSNLVSATGRLIAAYGGDIWTVLRKKYNAVPWDQAPGFATWRQEVEQARNRGWALDRDNFVAGLTVVAVPVFDAAGKFTHTLVATCLSTQLTEAATQDMVATMQAEAKALTDLLWAPG